MEIKSGKELNKDFDGITKLTDTKSARELFEAELEKFAQEAAGECPEYHCCCVVSIKLGAERALSSTVVRDLANACRRVNEFLRDHKVYNDSFSHMRLNEFMEASEALSNLADVMGEE